MKIENFSISDCWGTPMFWIDCGKRILPLAPESRHYLMDLIQKMLENIEVEEINTSRGMRFQIKELIENAE